MATLRKQLEEAQRLKDQAEKAKAEVEKAKIEVPVIYRAYCA